MAEQPVDGSDLREQTPKGDAQALATTEVALLEENRRRGRRGGEALAAEAPQRRHNGAH